MEQNRNCCFTCCCNPCSGDTTPPPLALGSFTAIKRDSLSSTALSGAAYTLYQNGKLVSTSVSSTSGKLFFTNLAPGEYALAETMAPEGYDADNTVHRVTVAPNGHVFIDGQDAEGFVLADTRNSPGSTSAAFTKSDATSGQPLSGAEFSLSDGTKVTSDDTGSVDLSALPPGTYTMAETSAPSGYRKDDKTYTVEVAPDGTITINGMLAGEFTVTNSQVKSDRPVITSVVENDLTITGTGTPGASISVTLPDGTKLDTTVGADGRWSVNIPDGLTLHANDTIYASQTVPGYAPSDNASFIVQPGQ